MRILAQIIRYDPSIFPCLGSNLYSRHLLTNLLSRSWGSTSDIVTTYEHLGVFDDLIKFSVAYVLEFLNIGGTSWQYHDKRRVEIYIDIYFDEIFIS
jgi:hypothetical protein